MSLSKIIIINWKLITHKRENRIILQDIVTWLNNHAVSLFFLSEAGKSHYFEVRLTNARRIGMTGTKGPPQYSRVLQEAGALLTAPEGARCGGAVAGGCSRPSGVWVRVRATLGTRSLGISLDFPPDNPPYLSTTHRNSSGGGGSPSQ